MAIEIRVPQIGESVVEATVGRWLKQEGDPIAVGDELVELETDKVNVTVPAEQSGVLTRIARKEGETVSVNEVLAVITEGDAAANGKSPSEAAPLPATSVSDRSVAPVAQPLSEAPLSAPPAVDGRPRPATPMAQRLAADRNLDLSQVPGSGSGGKVRKEDVANYVERAAPSIPIAETAPPSLTASRLSEPPPPRPASETSPPGAGTSAPNALPLPSLLANPARREERVPMTRLHQTAAQRLWEAKHTAAMLTTFNEVDMSQIMEIRKRRKEAFLKQHGVGLGFMSFFTKAAVGALKAFPMVNAELQGKEIVYKYYYDIGVAVSTDKGLVVPVLRDADRKTFAQIEKEIVELATRAREGKLTLPDLMGGTFTITNGGVFGSLMSTPILNAPQVGILGMHKIQERPVAVNGEVVIRPMMYLALSYDHRLINGREAVSFLVRIKEMIEDPETLLLEG
jgi:2-oxoglutarate dehydrogenase E2 component (dihydrolipoamide succinyltransferase)